MKISLIAFATLSIFVFALAGCSKALQVDEHGCKTSLGYSWCDAKQKCLHEGSEQCVYVSPMSVQEVMKLASDSECTEYGVISGGALRIDSDFKWNIGLKIKPQFERAGCSPVCVVSEEFKTANIDWRCDQ